MATFWHALCTKINAGADLQRSTLKTSDTSTSPITDAVYHSSDSMFTGSTASMTALTARDTNGIAIAGNEYFQGRFFIDIGLTSGGTEWASWVCYYPNPNFGDSAISCALTVPPGGIGVDVTY